VLTLNSQRHNVDDYWYKPRLLPADTSCMMLFVCGSVRQLERSDLLKAKTIMFFHGTSIACCILEIEWSKVTAVTHSLMV